MHGGNLLTAGKKRKRVKNVRVGIKALLLKTKIIKSAAFDKKNIF